MDMNESEPCVDAMVVNRQTRTFVRSALPITDATKISEAAAINLENGRGTQIEVTINENGKDRDFEGDDCWVKVGHSGVIFEN